jgi:heme/copper-type cytochrome/quinol oxidase subunit 2
MSTCILVTPEENTGGSNALVISLSVVGGLLVAVLVVYLIIRFRRKKNNQIEIKINKNCNDTLINDINKDLHLYQSFI